MSEPDNSYKWDCVESEITELPDLVSWCDAGSFRSLIQMDFTTISDIDAPPLIVIEDLLTWIEVDSGGDIDVTSTKSNVVTMQNSAVSYVYKNFGVDYFDIGTEIEFEFELLSGSLNAIAYVFALSNLIGTRADMVGGNDGILYGFQPISGDIAMFLTERTAPTDTDTYNWGAAPPTGLVYATFKMNALNSTMDLYSNAGRTILIDQLLTNQIPVKKRYLYATVSGDIPNANAATFYSQNFKVISNN